MLNIKNVSIMLTKWMVILLFNNTIVHAYSVGDMNIKLLIKINGQSTPVQQFEITNLSKNGDTKIEFNSDYPYLKLYTGHQYQMEVEKIDVDGNSEIVTKVPDLKIAVDMSRSFRDPEDKNKRVLAAVFEYPDVINVPNELPLEQFYHANLSGNIMRVSGGTLHAEYKSQDGDIGYSAVKVDIIATPEYIQRLRDYHMKKEGLTEEPSNWISIRELQEKYDQEKIQ